eukprot:gnl/TRDRNA2_/TRDRNA2_125263_c1_seq1.p1 gnl/TRDRNA2_/TRDRNA2_125263_c1~~gnl/TRDRNA2_/TRDRNA2_125263_c1_seq1.p1  ORF type:complete len:821 (+),score=160.68 gnl/TRDRNA2_/TRDRNA2_125263_c1_seq1:62-2464(+)
MAPTRPVPNQGGLIFWAAPLSTVSPPQSAKAPASARGPSKSAAPDLFVLPPLTARTSRENTAVDLGPLLPPRAREARAVAPGTLPYAGASKPPRIPLRHIDAHDMGAPDACDSLQHSHKPPLHQGPSTHAQESAKLYREALRGNRRSSSAPPAQLQQSTFGGSTTGDVYEAWQETAAVVRGELDKGIAEMQELNMALAHRRRDTAKTVGEAQRRKSRAHCRRRAMEQSRAEEQLQEGETAPGINASDSFNHFMLQAIGATEPKRVTEWKAKEDVSMPTRGRDLGPDAASTAEHDDRPSTTVSNEEGQDARRLRSKERRHSQILDHLVHKNPRESRMRSLSTFCKNGRKQDRMQRLMEARRRDFESLPASERMSLKEAFQKHDENGSASLDSSELLGCLVALGLAPRTDVEKRDLLNICQEVGVLGDVDFFSFCFELVPRVRQRLRELRWGPLLHEFNMYDKDGSGRLDGEECELILERLCTWNLDPELLEAMAREFQAGMKRCSDENGQIDFEGFQELVTRARNYHQQITSTRISDIYKEHDLDVEDVRQHSDELILLHSSFQQYDESRDGQLEWSEIAVLLIEYGLLPHDSDARDKTQELFCEVDSDGDGRIYFSEYLRLFRLLRKDRLEREEQSLRVWFDHLDRDKSSKLSMAEVSTLLLEVGLQPICQEDQLEMKRIIDEIDVDASGDLIFDEFQMLVQRLRERLSMAARRRQRVTANKLGLGERRVAELRHVFYDLDKDDSGFLSPEEVRQALDILRKSMSSEELRNLISKVDADGSARVNFESFLLFFATAPAGT